ncbi:hypothetical protein JYK22_21290, partial [Nonomuraea sp. RK-328]|nr:hypothetical protein [Nonomuraea sp. RK-328]
MTALLPIVMLFLLMTVCAVRDVSPDARSPRQVIEALRSRGWWSVFTVARVAGVVVLLVLVEACRIGWAACQFTGAVLGFLAMHLERVGHRPEVRPA